MYKDVLDDELLFLIEENEERAFQELIERYSPKINIIISKYKEKALQIGLDISDLYQEGLIGLVSAIKSYKKDKDTTFKTYADLLIERQVLDAVKKHNRQKNTALNNALSLDSFSVEESISLYNVIVDESSQPELQLINEEDIKEVRELLTEFEQKVYELKLEGKTNNEISIILDKNKRSIENTIQRIKQKIKEII